MVKIKNFTDYIITNLLTESKKGMLDISILNADKYLTSDKKYEEFFTNEVKIEMKTDGVKVTALKVASNGNLDDWIIAYKGNILYNDEYDYNSLKDIKTKSIGSSQFRILLEHFEKVASRAKSIPEGTEIFIEYLMNKPTLSSNYKIKHGMVLIASTKSTYKVKNGILVTSPGAFNTSKREEYAKLLGISVPPLLFEGIMGSEIQFEKGIKDNELKKLFNERKNSFHWNDYRLLYQDIKELLLAVESKWGGKEEGEVFTFKNGLLLKIQQSYQVDQEARKLIKQKYKEDDPQKEEQYWKNVRLAAMEISNEIVITKKTGLEKLMPELANKVKKYKIDFKHSKKDEVKIRDDIQLTAKTMIIKRLPGNNNSLIIGRFQPLTKGHQKMIDLALKETDEVYINIVKGKKSEKEKNPFSLELQEKMLKLVYGDKIHIMNSQTGNVITIINKIQDNINWIYCGTDRVQSYKQQLSKMPDIKIREIKRTDEDISATKVREALINDDFASFKKMTDKKMWSLYEELKNILNKNN